MWIGWQQEMIGLIVYIRHIITATILNKRLLVNYISFIIQGIVIKINLLLSIILSNFTLVIWHLNNCIVVNLKRFTFHCYNNGYGEARGDMKTSTVHDSIRDSLVHDTIDLILSSTNGFGWKTENF